MLLTNIHRELLERKGLWIDDRGEYFITRWRDYGHEFIKLNKKINSYDIGKYLPDYKEKYEYITVYSHMEDNETENVSLSQALDTLLPQTDIFLDLKFTSEDTAELLDMTLRAYLLFGGNIRGPLRVVFERITNDLLLEAEHEANELYGITNIIQLSSLSLIILSLIVLVICLNRFHHSLNTVLQMFARLQRKDLKSQIKTTQEFASKIHTPYVQFKQFFDRIEFEASELPMENMGNIGNMLHSSEQENGEEAFNVHAPLDDPLPEILQEGEISHQDQNPSEGVRIDDIEEDFEDTGYLLREEYERKNKKEKINRLMYIICIYIYIYIILEIIKIT